MSPLRIQAYFLPNIAFIIAPPILRSTPAFVVGIPVAIVSSRFTFVTPSALPPKKTQPWNFWLTDLRGLSTEKIC